MTTLPWSTTWLTGKMSGWPSSTVASRPTTASCTRAQHSCLGISVMGVSVVVAMGPRCRGLTEEGGVQGPGSGHVHVVRVTHRRAPPAGPSPLPEALPERDREGDHHREDRP